MKRSFGSGLAFWLIFTCALGISTAWGGTDAGGKKWDPRIRPAVTLDLKSDVSDYSIDLFFPLLSGPESLTFLNLVLRTDTAENNEQNIGIGYRRLLGDDKLILGGNLFFDTTRSRLGNRYNQFGVGLEALSKWLDFRANYYKPTGDETNPEDSLNRYRFGSTAIIFSNGIEEALEGFDAEAGVLVPFISNYVETRAYIGGYRYDSATLGTLDGAKARLEARPVQLVSLSIEFSDDDLGSATFVSGYLDIPFALDELLRGGNPLRGAKGLLALGKGARSVPERMTEKVVRDRNIKTVAGSAESGEEVADIIYVNEDNTDPGGGDGTLQDPYACLDSLPQDAEGYIYVFSSDGSPDTYEDTHLALPDNVVLWGEGYYHPVFKLGGSHCGSDPALNPILEGNGSDPVITLGDNNEIMGLTIEGGSEGIHGENIHGTNVHDNIIQGNVGTGSGIHIENTFSDPASISGLDLSYIFRDNQVLNNAGDGIFLSTTIEAPDITGTSITNIFEDNTVQGNSGSGIHVANSLTAEGVADEDGNVEASISLSSVENTFGDNSLGQNSGDGLHLENEAYAGAVNEGEGAGPVTAGITGLSVLNALTDNCMSENGDAGARMENTMTAYASNNGVLAGGISASVSDSSLLNEIEENTFSSNGGGGIYILAQLDTDARNEGEADSLYSEISGSTIGNFLLENETYENTCCGAELESFMNSFALNQGTIMDEVTSTISSTGLINEIEENDFSDNEEYGLYLKNGAHAAAYNFDGQAGSATASITGLLLGNVVSSNEMKRNGFDGAEIYNYLEADADNYNGEVGGGLIASITYSGIINEFEENDFCSNSEDGLDLYNTLDVYSYNFGTAVNVSAGISDLILENILVENEMKGNASEGADIANEIEAYAYNYGLMSGELEAAISGSGLVNEIEDNEFSENGDNGLLLSNALQTEGFNRLGSAGSLSSLITGFTLENILSSNEAADNGEKGAEIANTVDSIAANEGAIAGALSAAISESNIENELDRNAFSGNGDDGLYLGNRLKAEVSNWYGSAGSAGSAISGAAIENILTENGMSGNGGFGLNLRNLTGADAEDLEINLFMEENVISLNGDWGIYLFYEGSGTFTGDLGGGALGSAGGNSIFGNTECALCNRTGASIKAENNWWGSADDPDPVIGGDPVDHSPWLTAAP